MFKKGLDDLFFLESLWLNENRITKIDGLTNCKSLKHLYLSNNEITKLEGLDNLTELEVFWICENQVRILENLDGLQSLRQFWVAGNQLETIKNGLDKLVSLTELNVAGNKICSFKEILNLTRLPKLEVLSFYDPHFGDNPICLLGNYQVRDWIESIKSDNFIDICVISFIKHHTIGYFVGLRECEKFGRDDLHEEKDVLQYEDQDYLEMFLFSLSFDETCQKCEVGFNLF